MSHIEFWFWAGLSGVLIAAASWLAVIEHSPADLRPVRVRGERRRRKAG